MVDESEIGFVYWVKKDGTVMTNFYHACPFYWNRGTSATENVVIEDSISLLELDFDL